MTEEELYQTLTETGRLLRDVKPVEGEEYSLDAILAEFGQGAAESAADGESPAPEKAEEPEIESRPARVDTEDLRHTVAQTMEQMMQGETPPKTPRLRLVPQMPRRAAPRRDVFPAEPEGKRAVALEKVMSQTVESVLDEDDAILEPPLPLKQRLWERLEALVLRLRRPAQSQEDTESLWEQPERSAPQAEEPEMEMDEAAHQAKRRCAKLHRHTLLTGLCALVLTVWTVLDAFGVMNGLWLDLPHLQVLSYGGLLALAAVLAWPVWTELLEQARKGRVGCEAAAAVMVFVSAAECVRRLAQGQSGQIAAASVAIYLLLCLRGLLLQSAAQRETFRLAELGGVPPFGVSVTAAGSCKQRGTLTGLYRGAIRPDPARRWQMILVPLYVSATAVLSGVVALSRGEGNRVLEIWSLLLAVAVPFSLPLTGALPLRYLTSRLAKSGSAVAGYYGARTASRSRRVVITDNDLFPPGTVGLNGLKVFGEEIGKVVSYAASVTTQAHSQLAPLFEQLLTAEGGHRMAVEDLHFYEEGGVGGTIHGESVIMGSAYFMRKQHVTLPQELKLKTGVFLAVDGGLIAIFAIKYQPSRNVEWALRALRRNRMEPVMATRSCNVTPGLLRRRFNLDAKPVYPDVSTRLALSDLCEETAQSAPAVIYREGLMPLAEVVIGGRRMVRSVRTSTVLAYVGGLCGLLLGYYLTSIGAWHLLDPLRLLAYQALWLLPTWLLSGLVNHY